MSFEVLGLIVLALGLCAVSWTIGLIANREFRDFDRLPGLWSLTGKVARLDPRSLTTFLSPILLMLVLAIPVGVLILSIETVSSPIILAIAVPGVVMTLSQLSMLRATRRWASAQTK